MTVDFDNPPSKTVSPSKLAHVVLRTSKFTEMVTFYKTFLGAKASYENDELSFLTYDEEHHRIALINMPNLGPNDRRLNGMEHIAFTFDTLENLALAYVQRKAKGIMPYWSVNHGPTTSLYYQDPDGNNLETQFDNFETTEEADAFMASKEFAQNPIGVDFEVEDLIERLKSGEDYKEIRKRDSIGPRGMDSIRHPPAVTS